MDMPSFPATLLDIIQTCSPDELTDFLRKNPNTDPDERRGQRTPLYYAIERGDPQLVEQLLMLKPSVFICRRGYSRKFWLIHFALGKLFEEENIALTEENVARRLSVLKSMFSSGLCDMASRDIWGNTIAHRLIDAGRVDLLKLVIDSGCCLDSLHNDQLLTPVLYLLKNVKKDSISGNACNMLELLIKAGSDISDPLALSLAALSGNVNVVRMLLRNNCGTCRSNDNWWNQHCPVCNAAESGSLEVVKLLVEEGCLKRHPQHLDLYNRMGCVESAARASGVSTREFSLACVGYLLDVGSNFNKTWHTCAVVQLCLDTDNCHILRRLLEHGLDILCLNSDNSTFIHEAARRNAPNILEFVGPSYLQTAIDERDFYSRTPFFVSIQFGSVAAAKVLLKLGCDFDTCDKRDIDVLEVAVMNGRRKAVELILSLHGSVTRHGNLSVVIENYTPAVGIIDIPSLPGILELLAKSVGHVASLQSLCRNVIHKLLGPRKYTGLPSIKLPQNFVNYLGFEDV